MGQKTDHVETGRHWDAKDGYYYTQWGAYGERIPSSVLDFEGAGYILEAKQRPNFGALVDQKAASSSLYVYGGRGHPLRVGPGG